MRWPEWWDWELEFTSHLEKRMEDRDFTEVELREMLAGATDYREDVVEGRFVVEARHANEAWEVIVQSDEGELILVVITAYAVSE